AEIGVNAMRRPPRRERSGRASSAADSAFEELEAAERCGATPLFTIEPGYPPLLANLDHPPPMVYVMGRTVILQREAVAIVGSRDASAAGLTLARRFAADLSQAGFVVVSGLARGVDAAAHQAALATGTVAVIANGPGSVYPPEHKTLHAAIAETGAVVTEQPPGFRPRGKDFPRRNRIISGLSRGTLVIEAAERSGTLVTARLAAEQNREVFAVPGNPLDPRAAGTNGLIKRGAIPVTEVADIVDALGPITGAAPVAVRPSAPEAELPLQNSDAVPVDTAPSAPVDLDIADATRRTVIDALGPAPIPVDELVRATGLSPRDVQVVLIELSLAGRITHHGAQLVSKI
ncbi:MAG: DNA-processing protein DprA, partial [Pseudomonadota bacterium]